MRHVLDRDRSFLFFAAEREGAKEHQAGGRISYVGHVGARTYVRRCLGEIDGACGMKGWYPRYGKKPSRSPSAENSASLQGCRPLITRRSDARCLLTVKRRENARRFAVGAGMSLTCNKRNASLLKRLISDALACSRDRSNRPKVQARRSNQSPHAFFHC